MKRLTIFMLLLCHNALGQIILSEKTIDQFYEDNPTIESLEERVKAAEVLRGTLSRSFLPKVMLSYGQERYTTGPYYHITQPFGGIEAKVNVFNSGKDSLLNEQRNKEAAVANLNRVITKEQIKAEVLRTMSELAYLIELKNILIKAQEMNESNLKAAKQRISSGLATSTDTLDFEQQGISIKQQLTTLEFDMNVVKRMLLVLIGKNPKTDIALDFVNSHPEHAVSLPLKLDFNHSLLVAQADLAKDISLLDKKQSSRWWMPSIDVYAYALRFTQKEREYPEPGQRNDAGIGFRIAIPIFDGGEAIRVTQSKAAIVRSNEANARVRRLEVERDIENANSKLDLAHDLIHGAEDNVRVMDNYRKGVLNEYNRGIKNSPDMLQATQRWIQSRMQFAEVKRNYQFARADSMYLSNVTRD